MISLLISLLSVSAFAEPSALEDSQLAQASFRHSRPSVVRITVQTCNSKGKVRSLQLHVKDGLLKLASIDAVYAAGGRQRLGSNLRLEKGQSSNWLALSNRENPCLTRLEMSVGASSSRTTVEVIGRWER